MAIIYDEYWRRVKLLLTPDLKNKTYGVKNHQYQGCSNQLN